MLASWLPLAGTKQLVGSTNHLCAVSHKLMHMQSVQVFFYASIQAHYRLTQLPLSSYRARFMTSASLSQLSTLANMISSMSDAVATGMGVEASGYRPVKTPCSVAIVLLKFVVLPLTAASCMMPGVSVLSKVNVKRYTGLFTKYEIIRIVCERLKCRSPSRCRHVECYAKQHKTSRVDKVKVPCIDWGGSSVGGCIGLAANLPPCVPAADQAWSALPCDTRRAV